MANLLILSQTSKKLPFFFKKRLLFASFNKLYAHFFVLFDCFCVISQQFLKKLQYNSINKQQMKIMKKYMLVCAGLAMALAFTSCK
jgi:hypothetical protein